MPRMALVTGGAGFIGSHLVDALLSEGRDVAVIDDLSSGDLTRLPAQTQFHQVDIVDADAVRRVVDAMRPEVIFHLAAQSSVVVSVSDPTRDCLVNVQGTLNILEAASHRGIPIVFSSTGGALYGNQVAFPTPEDCIPLPLSPYGASKLAGEAYVRTWAAASEVPHTICRLGNVYGPRQSPHGEAGVVAILAHHLYAKDPPTLYGHGRPTRDYIFIADVVRALRASVGSGAVFNIATGIETNVMTIWNQLRSRSSTDLEPVLKPLRPGELSRSYLDVALAASELGWAAQVPLNHGLSQTFDALVAEFEGGASASASVAT